MSARRSGGAALLVALSLCVTACHRDTPRSDPDPQSVEELASIGGDTIVLVGAGDIAACRWTGDDSTAAIIDTIPGVVFTLGDNVYPRATAARMRDCYGPTWGRQRRRTRPALGNHDIADPTGSAYFEYFGGGAGPRGRGYYAYRAGRWLVVVLNTEITGADTLEQQRWLARTLDADTSRCQLAYGHQPRFSSGRTHGDGFAIIGLWRILEAHGVELALGGHDHDYERFAPMTAAGERDGRGIRSFVVGTGGAPLRGIDSVRAGSELRDTTAHGVLALTLSPDAYRWRFIRAGDGRVTDEGEGRCHGGGDR